MSALEAWRASTGMVVTVTQTGANRGARFH